MTTNSGIVVLDREAFVRRVAPATLEQGSRSKQILARYRGLEGEPWPDSPLSPFVQDGQPVGIEHSAIVGAHVGGQEAFGSDAVLLGCCDLDSRELERLGWVYAGYDVGYFEGEWSHYSSIFHEVLFGAQTELRDFVHHLNSYYLFPTLELAVEFATERERLLRSGRDVESGPVEPVAIHIRQEASSRLG